MMGIAEPARLETENGGTTNTTHTDGSVKLEGARQLVVLYRLEAKQVMKIRVASDDCTLDAGGLAIRLADGSQNRRRAWRSSQLTLRGLGLRKITGIAASATER